MVSNENFRPHRRCIARGRILQDQSPIIQCRGHRRPRQNSCLALWLQYASILVARSFLNKLSGRLHIFPLTVWAAVWRLKTRPVFCPKLSWFSQHFEMVSGRALSGTSKRIGEQYDRQDESEEAAGPRSEIPEAVGSPQVRRTLRPLLSLLPLLPLLVSHADKHRRKFGDPRGHHELPAFVFPVRSLRP